MADTGTFGKGCDIKLGNDAVPNIYTQIDGARGFDLTPPGISSADKKDTSSHSTTSNVRTYVDGMSDAVPGSLSFLLVYDAGNTQHAALLTAHSDGSDHTFTHLVKGKTASKTLTFSARVTEMKIAGPHDDIMTSKVTLTFLASPAPSWA